MKTPATPPNTPANGESQALVLSANCAAYRSLPNAVRREFWKICAVLPSLLDARSTLAACRAAAPACGLPAKRLYEKIRHYQSSQSWLALIDRRRAGPEFWKTSSKQAHKISPSLAAVVRKARVQQGLLNSLSPAEQEQIVAWLNHDGLTVRAVIDRVRQEFGIRATISSIRRFRLNFSAGRLPAPAPVEIRIEIVGNGRIIVVRGGSKH